MEINNYQISENFSFFELTDSDQFPHLVEQNRIEALKNPVQNKPTVWENLEKVCANILEVIYDEAGEKPVVLSGFRYGRLNRAVGGSWNSLHKQGKAVDITLYQYDIKQMFFKIFEMDLFKFHKLIYYKNRGFIHVSLPTGYNDGVVLLKDPGGFKVIA